MLFTPEAMINFEKQTLFFTFDNVSKSDFYLQLELQEIQEVKADDRHTYYQVLKIQDLPYQVTCETQTNENNETVAQSISSQPTCQQKSDLPK